MMWNVLVLIFTFLNKSVVRLKSFGAHKCAYEFGEKEIQTLALYFELR